MIHTHDPSGPSMADHYHDRHEAAQGATTHERKQTPTG